MSENYDLLALFLYYTVDYCRYQQRPLEGGPSRDPSLPIKCTISSPEVDSDEFQNSQLVGAIAQVYRIVDGSDPQPFGPTRFTDATIHFEKKNATFAVKLLHDIDFDVAGLEDFQNYSVELTLIWWRHDYTPLDSWYEWFVLNPDYELRNTYRSEVLCETGSEMVLIPYHTKLVLGSMKLTNFGVTEGLQEFVANEIPECVLLCPIVVTVQHDGDRMEGSRMDGDKMDGDRKAPVITIKYYMGLLDQPTVLNHLGCLICGDTHYTSVQLLLNHFTEKHPLFQVTKLADGEPDVVEIRLRPAPGFCRKYLDIKKLQDDFHFYNLDIPRMEFPDELEPFFEPHASQEEITSLIREHLRTTPLLESVYVHQYPFLPNLVLSDWLLRTVLETRPEIVPLLEKHPEIVTFFNHDLLHVFKTQPALPAIILQHPQIAPVLGRIPRLGELFVEMPAAARLFADNVEWLSLINGDDKGLRELQTRLADNPLGTKMLQNRLAMSILNEESTIDVSEPQPEELERSQKSTAPQPLSVPQPEELERSQKSTTPQALSVPQLEDLERSQKSTTPQPLNVPQSEQLERSQNSTTPQRPSLNTPLQKWFKSNDKNSFDEYIKSMELDKDIDYYYQDGTDETENIKPSSHRYMDDEETVEEILTQE